MRDQGSDDQVFYWLGLNRLAVEQWGTESGRDKAVFRPCGDEAGPDPEDDGWDFMGTTPANSNMAYATDAQRGRTMRVWYSGGGTNYAEVVSGDIEGDDQNPNDTNWADGDHGHFSMWIRSAAPGDGFTMYVVARVLKNGTTPTDVTFNITPLAGSPYTNGDHIVVPVGTHYMDGEWHYVEQDLLGIFEDLRPTWDFVQFDAMIVYAEDAYIDDIVLSGGSMARSYQVVPGMALGGTLAVQTGADGGEGVGAWETAYYHYNDLGTVLATTDSDGDTVGAWVPDYNGNYGDGWFFGYKWGSSPDRPEIGLTGKWWDEDAGLYYFNARWLDPERARWMSEDPLIHEEIKGIQFRRLFVLNPSYLEGAYKYSLNNSHNYVDIDGMLPIPVLGGLIGCGLNSIVPIVNGKSTKEIVCACGGGFVGGFIGTFNPAIGGATGAAAERLCNCGIPKGLDELMGMGSAVFIGGMTGAIGHFGDKFEKSISGGAGTILGSSAGSISDYLNPQCCK